jgi:hypothetical protein
MKKISNKVRKGNEKEEEKMREKWKGGRNKLWQSKNPKLLVGSGSGSEINVSVPDPA